MPTTMFAIIPRARLEELISSSAAQTASFRIARETFSPSCITHGYVRFYKNERCAASKNRFALCEINFLTGFRNTYNGNKPHGTNFEDILVIPHGSFIQNCLGFNWDLVP